MLQLCISQQHQVQLRQSLILKPGLESEYLASCLVRSETALEERDCQKSLYLVRGRDEDGYHSVLDYLLGLFMPRIKPAIFRFYDEQGPRLFDVVPFERIAAVDVALEACVRQLTIMYQELRRLSWRLDVDFRVLVNTYLDFEARPSFPLCGAPHNGNCADSLVMRSSVREVNRLTIGATANQAPEARHNVVLF